MAIFADSATNQSPPYTSQNLSDGDGALSGTVNGVLSDSSLNDIKDLGAHLGSAQTREFARLANEHKPVLKTYDARGNRIDEVEYHPAYHALMRKSVQAGLHCSAWEASGIDSDNRNLARGVRLYLASQTEQGHLNSLSVTHASIATLARDEGLGRAMAKQILQRAYDPSHKPMARKRGLTIGVGFTEKHCGSELEKIQTLAQKSEVDNTWVLNGHKWFLSAPMSDAFLILAQTNSGVSCFIVPRMLEDGSRNGLRLQRLKNKLGNLSNATAEVEFHNTVGYLLREEGQGISAIQDLLTYNRLDSSLCAAGTMRAAFSEAVHHARYRRVANQPLIDQPLMLSVLADVGLDVSAASALCFRLSMAYDRMEKSEEEALAVRILTPVVKYWTGKLAPAVTAEAMECIGGNGYIEESNLPRLYRESPGFGLTEGAGNVLCLDVLHAIEKNAGTLSAALSIIEQSLGAAAAPSLNVIRTAAEAALDNPAMGRILVEQLALTLAAAALRQVMPEAVSDAFMETRLAGQWRTSYGMLNSRHSFSTILNSCVSFAD
jgi:putative acyl-CoA dehydrogenase